MRSWIQYGLVAVSALVLAIFVTLMAVARSQAYGIIKNPIEVRSLPDRTPADFGLPYEEVTVTTSDGLDLVGWYVPSENGAVVIGQHGLKSHRGSYLGVADLLNEAGFGVLITSVRAHDLSEGDTISFGHHEMKDMQAWYDYLLTREDVDPDRIGIMGSSMGGSLVIQYASINDEIQAVVAESPFSSVDDTVETSVTALTGLPPFPFAPMLLFWAEQELGFDSSEINAKEWIDDISPRPVFIMMGGADNVVSPTSGHLLYDAAREPKELWFEPALGHVAFMSEFPEEYGSRVVGFFEQHLLDE